MTLDDNDQNKNDQNKMEVFTPRDVRVERRRVLPGGLRPQKIEKPPDLLAWWRVIRKRRWTVLTAFIALFTTVLVGSLLEKPVYRAKALIQNGSQELVQIPVLRYGHCNVNATEAASALLLMILKAGL